MGSCQDGSLVSADAVAGSLVWVRRRNGSWWPGQVLALDELPEGSQVPPRSGTPIKLLGREDGNVDWYNLEKSKRIKAFRCGEYDECIEKAKASASRPHRKSSNEGKYIRRNDAILHALELEKAHRLQGAPHGERMDSSAYNTLSRRSKHVNGLKKRPIHASRALAVFEENPARAFSHSMVLYEQTNGLTVTGSPSSSTKRRKIPIDSEDDTNDGIQRMRDLREIGMEMASKQKTNTSAFTKGSEEDLDSSALHASNFHHGFGSGNPINGSNWSSSSLKKKRSNMVLAYENLRRKCRRRPLSKLCKGTRVIIPTNCDWGPFSGQSSHEGSEEHTASGVKSFLKKAGFSTAMDSSPDSSGTSCEDALLDADPSLCNTAVKGSHLCLDMLDTEPSSMSGFIENGFFNVSLVMGDVFEGDCQQTLGSCVFTNFQSSAEEKLFSDDEGANSQYSRQPSDIAIFGSPAQANQDSKKRVKKTSEHSYNAKRIIKQQALSKKIEPLHERIANDSSNEQMESENDVPSARTKSVMEVGDVSQAELRSTELTCVSVAEQNSITEQEHDEHAEAVKKLANSDAPASRMPHEGSPPFRQAINGIAVEPTLYNIELEVQASYNGPRVPLVSLMSKLNGKAIVGHPVAVEVLEDGFCNPLVTQNIRRRVTGARGKHSDHKIAKSLKKIPPHGRKTGFSPRKMRRLSSITIDSRYKEEERLPVVDKMGGPTVACVPLRLVFSRINEALSLPARSENIASTP